MSQLSILKSLLVDLQNECDFDDSYYEYFLGTAKDIICELRYTTNVEPQYLSTQIAIAMELISKDGVNGQVSSGELGINRTYASADVSGALLSRITPTARTPWTVRSIVE